jgi:hypothetical protein
MQSLKERFAHAPRKPNENGPTIDWYDNAEGWKPTAVCTLGDLIDGIRGEDFAAKVAEVRTLLDQGDKPAADALKKTLPAVSLSGCITGRRKAAVAEGRFEHSGLLQIDLDAKDNVGWSLDEMREILQADPRMVAVFVTPSGAGLKGVARIPADATTHKSAFLAAEAHFKALNLKIDPSCKDPVRLCFVSHDPGAWLRLDTDAMFEPVELEIVEELDDEEEEEEERTSNVERRTSNVEKYHVSESGGLVIRGNAQRELDAATVADMLRVIPYPGYDKWLKITNAVWDALGDEVGTPILQAWAPEKKPGDYAEKFAHRLTDVRAATLVMFAKEHGWAPAIRSAVAPPPGSQPAPKPKVAELVKGKDKNTIPPHIFPVPAGEIGHDLSSRHIFSIIGPSNRFFIRRTTVTEVSREGEEFAMQPVTGKRFASEIETFGARVMRREMREDGVPRWRSVTFPVQAADIALASTAARDFLPHIRQLVSSPALVPADDGGCQVIGRGYHAHGGGTFITSPHQPLDVPLDRAVELLQLCLADFDFPDGGDASRGLASLLSPALKIGGWVTDDFPLDIAEADQSQSGKSYRFKIIHAIYREAPSAITPAAGGVGSLDERVSRALITGRPFISFDNFRGRMDSQILETAIRGLGKVAARALREEADIDCSPFLWQLSTNGAELTRDLANRSVITRIRKRAEDHVFQVFPEGDILAHVRANQPLFLGAVHAVIREWVANGRPMTNENRHDFRIWTRVMDWIVQNVFQFPPLLDGHREEQMRTANPRLQWLRDVLHAIVTDGYKGHGLTASDIAEAAEEHDIPPPGRRGTTEAAEVVVGKMLGRIFREAGATTITIDGREFTRQLEHEYDPISRHHRDKKTYVIAGFSSPDDDPEPEPQQALDL